MNNTITISSELDAKAIKYTEVEKTWGVVTLQAAESPGISSVPVDFVIIVDTSASMKFDSKLTFVQTTIEYLLSRLTEVQTLSLITFNHEARLLSKLLPCTSENKNLILSQLRNCQASGSTNISEALRVGTALLASRETQKISSLMLLTDGLSNEGLTTKEILDSLSNITIPAACTFNTFGLGVDHDSALLQAIALKAHGVYYYAETKEDIPSSFGECMAGILSTRAHRIKVQLRCNDGARLVTIATPFKIREQKVAKDYDIDMELMYSGEAKTIIFRAMPRSMACQEIVNVKVQYFNTISGVLEEMHHVVTVVRPETYLFQMPAIVVDEQLLRYMAASAIQEAVSLAQEGHFSLAQAKLQHVIHRVKTSASSQEPYCLDLIQDLCDCVSGMSNIVTFQKGMHTAHAFSSMYFMERSTGLGLKNNLTNNSTDNKPQRHLGYGYATRAQDEEARCAFEIFCGAT